MKDCIKRISVIVMAFVVLFSTVSFTVEKHICAGEVADISLMGNLERCEMPSDNISNSNGIKKQPCCKDVSHFFKSLNNELKSTSDIKLNTTQFAVVFFYTYQILFEEYSFNKRLDFKEYSPPLIYKDIPILYESFII